MIPTPLPVAFSRPCTEQMRLIDVFLGGCLVWQVRIRSRHCCQHISTSKRSLPHKCDDQAQSLGIASPIPKDSMRWHPLQPPHGPKPRSPPPDHALGTTKQAFLSLFHQPGSLDAMFNTWRSAEGERRLSAPHALPPA